MRLIIFSQIQYLGIIVLLQEVVFQRLQLQGLQEYFWKKD